MSAESTESRRAARILIVDDSPAVCRGLAEVISREKDLVVCGEAGSHSQAQQIIATAHPDLALVDLIPNNSLGLELIKDLHANWPAVRVLVFSMHEESLYAARAIRAGARGYINKRESMTQILVAIRQVLSGSIYVSLVLAAQLAAQSLTGLDRTGFLTPDSLSDRELEVLELVGQGLSTLQVAQKLRLDRSTVATYRARIKQKCGLHDALELLQFAIRWRESERLGSLPALKGIAGPGHAQRGMRDSFRAPPRMLRLRETLRQTDSSVVPREDKKIV